MLGYFIVFQYWFLVTLKKKSYLTNNKALIFLINMHLTLINIYNVCANKYYHKIVIVV